MNEWVIYLTLCNLMDKGNTELILSVYIKMKLHRQPYKIHFCYILQFLPYIF